LAIEVTISPTGTGLKLHPQRGAVFKNVPTFARDKGRFEEDA
jgi:hypothetical protein